MCSLKWFICLRDISLLSPPHYKGETQVSCICWNTWVRRSAGYPARNYQGSSDTQSGLFSNYSMLSPSHRLSHLFPNNFKREVIIPTFHRQENQGSGRLSNLPRVIEVAEPDVKGQRQPLKVECHKNTVESPQNARSPCGYLIWLGGKRRDQKLCNFLVRPWKMGKISLGNRAERVLQALLGQTGRGQGSQGSRAGEHWARSRPLSWAEPQGSLNARLRQGPQQAGRQSGRTLGKDRSCRRKLLLQGRLAAHKATVPGGHSRKRRFK